MSGTVTERLAAHGLELPAAPAAVGAYLPAVRSGALVFTSGQLPMEAGVLIASGTLGGPVDIDTGRRCAELCALRALAAASAVADLDAVVRVVKLVGYVASEPGFTAQPSVIDGASAVMGAAFGAAGEHAREAVGVAALPLGAPVEVSIVLELG
jgi:enamine deaminase RidA (YjgF/YER057c/UK114 family)